MPVSRRSVVSGLATLTAAAVAFPRAARADGGALAAEAEAARTAGGLPALAVRAGRGGDLLDQAAVGVRARGAAAPVTTEDRWHVGSCAKAMTATLVARMVERGRFGWDTPLAELLPDLATGMHPATGRITLYELMTMRSGLPGNPVGGLTVGQMKGGLKALQAQAADDRARRLLVAERMLKSAPKKAPGTAFAYSNTSYILLGAILEQAGGDSFDRLIAREVFEPLKITSFGFGAPGGGQPLGHEARANGKPVAPESPDSDLPSFMRPAGGIHVTLADWDRFVADQVAGETGGGALLSPETYVRLHTRPGPEFPYAGGWGVSTSQGRRMLSHVGNNTLFTAFVQAFPGSGHVFLCASNDGRDAASVKAFQTLAKSLAAQTL